MVQEVVYKKTKSHWDESGWNSAKPGHGTDTHSFTMPEGMKFARYSIDVEVASLASGINQESTPKPGATGEQVIRVRWWYNPFGKVRYTISAYAGDPETVVIRHGENNWAGKALIAMDLGQNVNLLGRGPVAKKLLLRLKHMSDRPVESDAHSQSGLDRISVNRGIALGLVATVKYGVIGGILLAALGEGYDISATFDPHGPLPFDDELTIGMAKGPAMPLA